MAEHEHEHPPTAMHDWRGPRVVANGRIYSGDCDVCGWPKPDHPRASEEPTPLEEA